MANLWTPSTVKERKNALQIKFSQKTLNQISQNINFQKESDELDKKYSKSISSETWNKRLK